MKLYAEKYAQSPMTLDTLQATKLKVVNEGSIQQLKHFVQQAEAKAVKSTSGILGKTFLAPLLKKPTPDTVRALSDLYLEMNFETKGASYVPPAPTSPYDAARKFLEIRENPEILPAGTPPRRNSDVTQEAGMPAKKKSVTFVETPEIRVID